MTEITFSRSTGDHRIHPWRPAGALGVRLRALAVAIRDERASAAERGTVIGLHDDGGITRRVWAP